MLPLLLCREHLNRILSLLDRHEGGISMRDFWRTHRIEWWELEQAEKLGWISISRRKPPRGRPSRLVEKINNPHTAKLPPPPPQAA